MHKPYFHPHSRPQDRTVSAALALLLMALPAMGCGGKVAVATVDPQVATESLLTTEQVAWNANDSGTYASVYSDDADFINVRGQVFSGRPAIAQVHAMIFGGPFKGSKVTIALRLFKLLAPGVALVDTDQEVTGYAFLPPGVVASSQGVLATHFKYVAVQQTDGSWKFVSGQNTAVLP